LYSLFLASVNLSNLSDCFSYIVIVCESTVKLQ
jgi:hypothetical protein